MESYEFTFGLHESNIRPNKGYVRTLPNKHVGFLPGSKPILGLTS
jgi:hypothetical protein